MAKHDPFALLYQSHAPNVLGLLLRLCDGNRAEAEDLTQETFVAAFEGRERFAGRGSARAWLMGIAVRRWRDRGRRREVQTVAPAPGYDDLPDAQAGRLAARVVDGITLDAALRRLEPRHREALLLVVSQRLTYREAAQAMDEPVGTVKWRVHQATRQMQAHLRAVEEETHETLGCVARRRAGFEA